MQLYLFGAGASSFSGECIPAPPPLGGELFNHLAKVSPILRSITPDLADVFRGDGGFESGMAEFIRTRPGDRAALLRDMARYFLQFAPGKDNSYRQLIRNLRTSGVDFVLATLNYEMLIELSAVAEGYDEIAYVQTASPEAFRILKLHGSSNFVPDLGKSTLTNIKWGNSARHLKAPVKAVGWREAQETWRKESSIAPAMSLYSAGKEVLFCDDIVVNQQNEWRSLCATATDVFIVGVRVWPSDTHIWDPLAQAPGVVRYVGKERDIFLQWCNKNRTGPREIASDDFAEFVTRSHPKIGRNQPCPCGSGKKHKKCHGAVV